MAITLTVEQHADLTNLEATVKEAETEIARAKSAGIDVSDLEEKLKESKALRLGLLKIYAPKTVIGVNK